MHPLFALFQRAIREHVRSGALVGARLGLAVTLLACLIYSGARSLSVGASGLEYFQAIIFVNALYITLAGCSYFASVITEEKEQGTLGLLRMTDISPLALLLGKGTSRLLDGVLLLSVQIPFMLIGITLGGITWTQVFAAYAGLAAYLFLLCNVALLCSVLAGRSGLAAMFSCIGAWVILYGGTMSSALLPSGFSAWESLNIFELLKGVMTTNFNGPIFSSQFTVSLLLGVGAFVCAWMLFDRFGVDSDTSHSGAGIFGRLARPVGAGRAPVFWMMRWKDFHFIHGGNSMMKWKYLGYGLVSVCLALFFLSGRMGVLDALEWGMWTLKFGILAIFAELAIGTSRMMRLEVRDRTLPTLAVLPTHTVASILEEKQIAVRRTALPALGLVGVGILICLATTFATARGLSTVAFAVAMAPFVIACLAPYILAEGLLLQRFIIYCSLRYSTGSVPIAIGVWLLANVTILAVLAPIFNVAAFVLAIIPVAIWAGKLRVKNLKLIEQLAAE